MADSSALAPPAGAAPPPAAPVPVSQPPAPVQSTPTPPAPAPTAPKPTSEQQAAPSDVDMSELRQHLEVARKLPHDKLIVEAANANRMRQEYEELLKFRAQTLAEKESAAQKEYETRKTEFMGKKDQLKAVGWDLDKKEILDSFEGYLKEPTNPKNAWVVVAIQQAKENQEKISKEAADAQSKAREAQERDLLASKWGQGVLEKVKRSATEASVASQAQARTAPTPAPQAPAAQPNPLVAAQDQMLGLQASQLHGLNRDPALQGLLGTMTHELLSRARQLANSHQNAVLQETATGSTPARAFTHLYRQQRTDQPIVTKQGADGGAFTGTPISGIAPTSAEVNIGDIANDLARTGRWKDMAAASVLKCDGRTFVHPVTGVEFPIDELMSGAHYDSGAAVFSPFAIAANLLSAGEGMNIPWDNRVKVQDYYQPKAPRR